MKIRQTKFAMVRTHKSTSEQEEGRKTPYDNGKRSLRRARLFGFAAAIAVVISFVLCPRAFAQTSQGFTGLVTDSTGAVIPTAKITVHNEGTGVDKSVTATSTGNWSVPFLDPGVYDVRAEADRFKSVDKTNITLETGQTATVNFALSPGEVTETVSVNASADVLLDYAKADRGMVIENKSVQQLPVFDGNTFNLAYLAPGFMSTTTGTAPGNQSAQTYGIHGASVEFSIDGVSNQSATGPEHYTYAPPVDALQEFKITDNAYDAANGRSPGGQIDMTLKTGTKKLHGAAYEYLQRAFLNANTSTNDANIAKSGPLPAFNKGASTTNQYGFELDGPVLIPRFWHGNRQTFFTILYEDLHNKGIGTSTVSVPTPAMIGQGSQYPGQADFSALLGATVNGAAWNGVIYDPMSETACTNNNTDNGTYAKGNPHVCRYQFGFGPGAAPGPQGNPVQIGPVNVIPANRLSPVALAYMSWYPAPNLSPTPTTANPFNANYVGLPPGSSDNKTYLVKLDQNVGENDTFDVTAKLWKYYGQSNNAFPRNDVNAAHPGINEAVNIAHYNGTDYRYPSLNTSWTHTFSPTWVNSIRGLITTALESDSTGPANGYNPTNLGFSANIAAANATYFNRFPLTNISNFNALGSQTVLLRGDDALQVADTVNWTHGNHTIHFGGDIRFAQYSQKSSNGNGITLGIGDAWSQQWDTNVTGTTSAIHSNVGYTNNYSGNSIASMMLGTWDSGTASAAGGQYFSSHYGALYFQDDWKYRPNLTINFGVRWEDPGRGLKDRFNRLNSGFDMTDTNPISGMVNTTGLPVNSTLLGGPTWAGVNGNPDWEYHHVLYQFGPRAGFAYTLNEKTVIRGGLGLFFNDQANGNQNQPNQYGYSTSTGYTASNPTSLGSSTIINPLNNMANPFPTFQTATGNCGGNQVACLITNAGQALSFENYNYHPAEVLESSFGIERQLSNKDTIEISYAGTRSYNNATSDDINHINATAQAACDPLRGGNGLNCTQAYGSKPAAGTTVGYVSNPFYNLAPFAASGSYYTNNTIQTINFTRPYSIFQGITENRINGGKSWYNAVEVVFNHRTSFGLTTHVTYGYSKAISSGGYVDTVNRIPARSVSGTDDPHRLAISGVYVLPIAKGYGIFPNMPRYLDFVVGGWQTGAIYLWQTGLPQSLTSANTPGSSWIVDMKANGGALLPRKRFWPGNSNPWFPSLQAGPNSYIQRMKPCVATTDPNSGALIWAGQSQPLVAAGLCSTPNFIKVGNYGAIPNIVYSGIRFGPNNQLDMNVSKNFKVVKGMVFQARLDAFNALNHVQQTSSTFDTSNTDGYFGTYQMGTSGGGNKSNRFIQINGRLTW